MEKVEQGLQSLKEIKQSFQAFFDKHEYITEADTRINLIDKILKEVLFWPDIEISRESKSENGYLDYLLRINGKKFVCVEAKREGKTFTFPNDKLRKYYKINGVISTDENLI